MIRIAIISESFYSKTILIKIMVEMIKKISIVGFKSIGEKPVIMDLKPLTILTGPNGSGKSSILECIALISQLTRFSPPRTLERSLTGGEFVQFPNTASVMHKGQSKFFIFDLELLHDTTPSVKGSKSNLIEYSFRFNWNTKEYRHEFSLNGVKTLELRRIKIRKTYESHVFLKDPDIKKEVDLVMIPDYTEGYLAENFFTLKDLDPNALKQGYFKKPPYPINSREYKTFINYFQNLVTFNSIIANIIKSSLKKVFFISTQRGSLEFAAETSESAPSWVGSKGEKLVPLLSLILSKRRYSSIADDIVKWCNKFGISDIHAGWTGRKKLEADYQDDILKVPVDLPQASFGSRQVASIITQVFWSKPDDVIMIEEPEISLHPQSQLALLELFTEAVNQGKQIIISTHSPIMVLALSKVVSSKKIGKDEVAIYHVEKSEEGSYVTSMKIDQKGYVENWIPSFKKVEDELFNLWSESL